MLNICKDNIIKETNTFSLISTKNLNKNFVINNVDKINWYDYIHLTDDLLKAGITTKDKAYAHLINHGIYEHRMIKVLKDTNKIENKIINKSENKTHDTIENIINSFSPFIIVNCLFGLGNRLRALASAYSICKSRNYKLIINWILDDHCNCKIEDLITNINDIGFVCYKNINILKLNNIEYFNYYEKENNGKKDEFINFDKKKIILLKQIVL